ncbi:MAG TPA: secondary thiamine-phosphate synthase enzyme YjbQ [Candidatus Krumholzibacteria bacterium]|nr:secondary thiamine-phosphate synthase enzyme YjbQ [Candidatus Krumholzibacteria bacterium]HRX51473.1 secondary thiamine-phosphate synthase enzyme YjbQ [Candidatus Krumholzibacteria bacterium]
MTEFEVRSQARAEMIDMTAQVQTAVHELGVTDGAVLVWVPHTTAGVTVNEGADPDVPRDMLLALERMVPWEAGYRHAEGNAAAHVKSSLMGCGQLVPVRDGRLDLGTWQAVWFCEFDGPRRRRVSVRRAG